jgi:lipid-binding SYLF domain-containing protein
MRARTIHTWKLLLFTLSGIFIMMSVLGCPGLATASGKAEAQAIVDKSRGTLAVLLNDENYSLLHEYLKKAKGVVIFPQIIKAGYILGGSGGTGVLLVRNGDGTWSDPAFYTLGSITFGLQIGGEVSEVIMVALNTKAVNSLLTSSVKLGGDVSIAVGPVGGGAKGAMSIPDVTADFISFSKTKGLYGGLNFEGAVMNVRDGLNISYYSKDVSPMDILVKRSVTEPGAAELRSALGKATSRQ